jgi:hypothetical protein
MKKYPFYYIRDPTEGYRGPAAVKTPAARLPVLSPKRIQRKKEGQRGMIIGVGFFLTLNLGVLTAALNVDPNSFVSHISLQTAPAELSSGLYNGKIVLETIQRKRCRRMTFDNKTGRVSEISELDQPCEELADLPIDDKGLPKPVGTIARLDAIGKSFLKR